MKSKKILAIDDNHDNLITVKAVLQNYIPDAEVLIALSGKEGIEIAKKEHPDAILLDIIMPGMDGYEVCKMLKSDEQTKQIPVIMLTATKTDSEHRIKGLKIGADAFCAKPIDPAELSAQINVMLRIKKAEDELRQERDHLDVIVQKRTKQLRYQATILENVMDAVISTDMNFIIKSWNKGAENMYGYTEEEAKGQRLSNILKTEFYLGNQENYIEKILKEEKTIFEVAHHSKKGKHFFILSSSSIIKDSDGNSTGIAFINKDITEKQLALTALRFSEDKFRSMFENMAAAVCLDEIVYEKNVAVDYRILDVNPSYEKLTGISKDKAIGNLATEIYGLEKAPFLDIYSKVAETGQPASFETFFSPLQKYLQVTASCPSKGKFSTVFSDITDRKLAEIKIHESEDRFIKLFEFNTTGQVLINKNTRVIEQVNLSICELIGLSKEEIIGKTCHNFLCPNDCYNCPIIDHGQTVDKSKRILINGKGERIPVLKSVAEINMGGVDYLLESFTDITELKIAELALMESESKFRLLAENISDVIWTMDLSGNYLYISPSVEKLRGFTQEEALKQGMKGALSPESAKIAYKILEENAKLILQGQHPSDQIFSLEVVKKDGTLVWTEITTTAVYDNNDSFIYILGVTRDITERRKAEEAIKESAELFSKAFSSSPIAITLTRMSDGKFIEVNQGAEKITGYSREELIGHTSIEMDLYVNIEDRNILIAELLKSGSVREHETRFYTKQHKIISTLQSLEIIEINGEKCILSAYEDITERLYTELIQKLIFNISNAVVSTQDTEELVDKIREQLSFMIDTTNFFIAFYDSEKDILSLPYIKDDNNDIKSIPAKGTLTKHLIKNHKSLLLGKEEMSKMVASGIIEIVGKPAENWLGVTLFSEGKPTGAVVIQSYDKQITFSQKDLEMLEFVSDQISISVERKIAEEKIKFALEKSLESDKLKSAFLATMSHELRTPLNAVIGFSEMVDEDLDKDEAIEFSKIINISGKHLLSIIEDMFDLSLLEANQVKITKVKTNIRKQTENVHQIILAERGKIEKENIEIKFITPIEIEEIIAETDSVKLNQILINLLKNALKFTDTGKIEYGYEKDIVDGKGVIKFHVKDTGIGISKENQKIIFDMFRQLNDSNTRMYGGTGIGLAVAKRLSILLGGDIWVDSVEGLGSTFYFTIPYESKSSIQADLTTNGNAQAPLNFSGKTILIAEDDENSYELLNILLKRTGVKVIWAKNGKVAVDQVLSDNSIDLVLMDLRMPVLDGYLATRRVKSISPKLPVIIQTAHALPSELAEISHTGCDGYIFKPIRLNELMGVLSKYLR